MSVFLTPSAMGAVTVLSQLNKSQDQTQNAILTGKKVSTAADNPAIWAVSQQLSSEQSRYSALSETLSLGKATVSVSRIAAEKAVELLTEIKTEIIAASASGANTTSIQSSIEDLGAQVDAIVAGANFNGVNLLQNSSSGSSSTYSILSGISTDSSGNVSTSTINVSKQDLQSDAATFGTTAATATDYFSTASSTVAASGSVDLDVSSSTVAYGASYRVTLQGAGSHDFGTTAVNFEYVARLGDTNADVAKELQSQIDDYIEANDLGASLSTSLDSANGRVTINNLDADAADTITVTTEAYTGGSAGGALEGLGTIDVTTTQGQADALAAIETMIETATASAANLGTAETRIDVQAEFLMEADAAVQAGISALVDANISEESARLAAQQAQRELALEMLSIANNQRQSVLSLFQ